MRTENYQRWLIGILLLTGWNGFAQQQYMYINATITNGDYKAAKRVWLQEFGRAQPSGTDQVHLFVDKDVLGNPQYLSTPYTVSNLRALDKNLEPGSIPASYGVGSSGVFSYVIPIQVPPGTNGMAPELSLVYSSGSGEGEIGVGWNLAGFSAISRVPKDLFHNGTRSGIEFNTTGPFALDGNRLAHQGANGSGQNYYFTESETFSKITYIGPHFEVRTKSGMTMTYGGTANSRLTLTQGIVTWYLSKTMDNYGNYTEYDYSNVGNEVIIKEIKYTGNTSAGISPYNKVRFFYDTKTTILKQYMNNNLIESKALLREISVYGENSDLIPVFNYDLKFSSGDYNKLSEITFSGMNGKQLNSTVFVYDEPTTIRATITASTQITLNNDCSAGDFNGDGLTDLIAFQYNPSLVDQQSGSKSLYSDWYLLLNTGNGFPTWADQGVQGPFLPFSNFGNTMMGLSPVKNGFMLADVVGDDAPELIYGQNANGLYSFMKVYQYNSPAYQLAPVTLNTSYPNGFTVKTASLNAGESLELMLEDFDGNGKSEMISFWKKGSTGESEFNYMDFANNVTIFRASTGSTPLFVTDLSSVNRSINQYSGLTAFDFNGDGKAELIGKRGNDFYVISVTVNGTSISLAEIIQFPMALDHTLIGDYNGDGLPDFAKQAGTPAIYYGTGTTLVNNCSFTGLSIYSKMLSLDVNGDGKKDLVQVTAASSSIHISVCPGGKVEQGFTTVASFPGLTIPEICNDELDAGGDRNYNGIPGEAADLYSNNPMTIPLFTIGDYDGNGTEDILIKVINGGVGEVRIINFNSTTNEMCLTHVFDGNNNEIKIGYSTLPKMAKNTLQYSRSSTAPVLANVENRTLPITVVSDMTDYSDGVGMINSYTYHNLLSHTAGRGLLGFDKVISSRFHPITLDNYQTTEEFGLDPTYLVRIPAISKKEFLSSNGNKIYYTTTYNSSVYGYATGATSRYFSKLNSVLTLNNYINSTTNTIFTYDNATGNVLTKIENIGSGKKVTVVNYNSLPYINAGSWLANVPQQEIITIGVAGESQYNKAISYTYDASKGSLLSSSIFPGDAKSVVTTNVYNANTGVLTQQTTSAPNDPTNPPPAPVTINYSYDFRFRFVETTTSPLGYVSGSNFDPVFGNKVYTKGIDGLVVAFKYDDFGKITEMSGPDNSKTNYTYGWFTANDPLDPKPVNTDAMFFNSITHNDGKYENFIFDNFGRLVKTETNTFDGKKVSNLTTYNNMGEVYKVYGSYLIPLPGGKAVLETTNSYLPDIGKLISSTVTDGVTTLTSSKTYNFNTTTKECSVTSTTPDSKTTTRITDELGNVVRITDNQPNVLEFGYHFNGVHFLNTVKLNNTEISTVKTDKYHHLVQEIAPNTGTVQYTYDSYGRLRSKVDNKGTVYSYAYDIKDRVTQKVIGAETFNITYNNSGLGISQIKELSLLSGPAERYSYDNMHRVSQVEEFADGTSWFTKYTYDNFGRIDKHIYPNNFEVTNTYVNGDLTEIRSNDELLWKVTGIDNCGTINKYILADGVETSKSFDNFGNAQAVYAPGVQDMGYDINKQNGNLNAFFDNTNGRDEEYGYDQMDRLVSIDNSSYPAVKNITYDPNGNIATKYDAGTYTYHGIRINQVKKTDNSASEISPDQQDITYNSCDQPTSITEDIKSTALYYGPHQQRYKSTYSLNGSLVSTRYYLDGYEKTILAASGTTAEINYVNAPTGLCAMNVTENGISILYSVYNDHVGSIVTLTDPQGNVAVKQNFDAWGRRRDAYTHDYTGVNAVPYWLYRGFTGHEQLPAFDLINMNSRLYDPKVARMLSADPVLLDPENSQAYNKYSYANNNPLKFTDPSGNVIQYAALGLFVIGSVMDHALSRGSDPMYKDESVGDIFKNGFLDGYNAFNQIQSVATFQVASGQYGNTSFNISANVLGGAGLGVGLTANVNQRIDFKNGRRLNLGLSASADLNGNTQGAKHILNQLSIGAGADYGTDRFNVGLSSTRYWSDGVPPQTLGGLSLGGISDNGRNWGITYQNDGALPFFNLLGDGGDSYRTAALRVRIDDFSFGFNLMTEARRERLVNGKKQFDVGTSEERWVKREDAGREHIYNTNPSRRLGGVYVGHKNNHIGFDSDAARKVIQNDVIHRLVDSPSFRNKSYGVNFYGGHWSTKPYSLW